MHIALVGYGRMGHEIERIATRRGHAIIRRIDPVQSDADLTTLTSESLDGADVAVEFSLPDAVLPNARVYAGCRVPAVVGTTGLGSRLDEITPLFLDGGAYLWGSNYSVGAHLFFALVGEAATLCRDLDDYDVLMYEIHHRGKQDSPSGTALAIAKRIIASGKKKRIVTERLDRKPEADELHVASVRGGTIPGVHTVVLDSEADTIELTHTARNRSGFALGAVLAAEWIVGKSGVFSVEDFVAEFLAAGEET
jgi:4-hydroxy-tetrahydrodipicolinate reductase